MGALVGILLVVIAGSTVIGVLWFVMREQHVHEEYYIPQAVPPTSARANNATSVDEAAAETRPTSKSKSAADDTEDTTA